LLRQVNISIVAKKLKIC